VKINVATSSYLYYISVAKKGIRGTPWPSPA
jgi:hypothetical protein